MEGRAVRGRRRRGLVRRSHTVRVEVVLFENGLEKTRRSNIISTGFM